MPRQLENKRALATGGSRGIGAAAVKSLARDGNYIQPGPIDTDMNPADGDFADSLRKLMALPRYGVAEEIAALVVYLAGPEAGFVTGASLAIDGGFTA
jgi:NAD(P)-dependent dehydrogenase (short-subunit alcohol dehydrogenase family)